MTEKETYCIVKHSSRNGYVVRTAYNGWLPQPYTNSQRLAEYKVKKIAQKEADKLNQEDYTLGMNPKDIQMWKDLIREENL